MNHMGLDSEPLTTALSQQLDMSRHRTISGATLRCQGSPVLPEMLDPDGCLERSIQAS